jgi:O-antigen/teichoic acid export membrane protein
MVLGFTYAAERFVALAVIMVPVLAGASEERVGILEIALAAGSLGATVGPVGTVTALMHERFRERRANILLALGFATVGAFTVGTLFALQLGWVGMFAGGLLGIGLGWNRVAQNRMRVEGTRANLGVTLPLVAAFAVVMAAAPLLGVDYADIAPLAVCAGGLAGLIALRWLLQDEVKDGPPQVEEMIRFGLPLSLGAAAVWVVNSADRYLIGWLIGIDAVGAYGPMYRVTMMFSGAASTLVVWWRAESLRLGADWSHGRLRHFVNIALPATVVGGLVAWWPFTEVLSRIVDRPWGEIGGVVAWLLVSVVAWTLASGILIPLVTSSASQGVAIAWTVAAVVNIGLNLLVIPRFGLPGAAATTAAAQGAALAVSYWILLRWRERSAPNPS